MYNREDQLSELLKELFAMSIKDEQVKAVLVEEKIPILQEYYLCLTNKGDQATPILIASAAGGIDIEEVAQQSPDKIVTIPFNILVGPVEYQVKYIAQVLGCRDVKALKELVDKMFQIMRLYDATLVEINPLAVTKNGLIALDAKMILDDKAGYRQGGVFSELLIEQNRLSGEKLQGLKENTITYIPLDGTVGLLSDGAGTGMLTLDLVNDAGGKVANFCELGGITNSQAMYDALDLVMDNRAVKSLLVVLIGGFNRMDEMAEGIITYQQEKGLNVPIVVRMCGTKEEEGKEMMRQANLPTCDNLYEAVEKAVALAGGEK